MDEQRSRLGRINRLCYCPVSLFRLQSFPFSDQGGNHNCKISSLFLVVSLLQVHVRIYRKKLRVTQVSPQILMPSSGLSFLGQDLLAHSFPRSPAHIRQGTNAKRCCMEGADSHSFTYSAAFSEGIAVCC